MRVEIKDPYASKQRQELTKLEQKVFDEWKGEPPHLWKTSADLLNTWKYLFGKLHQGRVV